MQHPHHPADLPAASSTPSQVYYHCKNFTTLRFRAPRQKGTKKVSIQYKIMLKVMNPNAAINFWSTFYKLPNLVSNFKQSSSAI